MGKEDTSEQQSLAQGRKGPATSASHASKSGWCYMQHAWRRSVCLSSGCLMCCKSGFYKRSHCHFCKRTKNLELTSSGLAGLGAWGGDAEKEVFWRDERRRTKGSKSNRSCSERWAVPACGSTGSILGRDVVSQEAGLAGLPELGREFSLFDPKHFLSIQSICNKLGVIFYLFLFFFS